MITAFSPALTSEVPFAVLPPSAPAQAGFAAVLDLALPVAVTPQAPAAAPAADPVPVAAAPPQQALALIAQLAPPSATLRPAPTAAAPNGEDAPESDAEDAAAPEQSADAVHAHADDIIETSQPCSGEGRSPASDGAQLDPGLRRGTASPEPSTGEGQNAVSSLRATPLPVVPDAAVALALPVASGDSPVSPPLPFEAPAPVAPPVAVLAKSAPPSSRADAKPIAEHQVTSPDAKPRAAEPADGPSAATARPFDLRLAPFVAAAPIVASQAAAPAAAPAEILIGHRLDLAQGDAWLDRLAQDIARSADGDARLRFALAPEHLGRLTVELANGADGTVIRLTTESEQAQRIVADAQPRLIAEARAQGLRVSDTQVDLDQRSGGQQQPQQPGGNMGGQSGGERARPTPDWPEPRRPFERAAAAEPRPTHDLYA